MSFLFRVIRLPLAITFAVFLALLFLTYALQDSTWWSNFEMENGIEDFFCEVPRMDQLVREPMNTLTNLPFVFFGSLMILLGTLDRKYERTHNLMVAYPIYSYLWGISALFLFSASTFFHASLITSAQLLDMSGVYALSLLPVFYNLHRIFNLAIFKETQKTSLVVLRIFLVCFIVFVVVLTSYKWELDAFIVIPSILACILLTVGILGLFQPRATNKKVLLVSAITILLGIGCYALDVKKVGCANGLMLPPHAIWHLFAAVSTFTLYLYLRSENLYKTNNEVLIG